jgi:Tfp pilus assembly protein PilN
MIQQINLYHDNIDTRSQSNLYHYLLVLIASIMLLLISSGLSWYQIGTQQSKRQLLQNQLQQSTTELLTLQSQLPNPQNDALLDLEIQQAQTRYQNLSRIMELLTDTQQDQTRGFSHYLNALAEQADSSAWLSRIKINTISNDISLYGSSFQPQPIPLLLQRLQTTSAFKGRSFARLNMQQSDKAPEQINFSVSSSLKPDTEDKDDN